jgi:cobalt transporter subunit CbtB
MTSQTIRHTSAASTPLAKRLVAAALACMLGTGLIFLAGFSHVDAIHNGAHDTRHSEGFPCH